MIHRIRGWVMPALLAATLFFLAMSFGVARAWHWGLAATLPLLAVGAVDLLQSRHSILRNYPVLGHLRFLLEDAGPELRQYIVEANTEGRPFNREQRALVYQRAKGVLDKKPFGTELDVYRQGYGWIAHSLAPRPVLENAGERMRVRVGLPDTPHPYDASFFNISAMSFGALSANAVLALNEGARLGGFAHNTGEGGLSRYHREPGGDLVWQIGTGYFGCRRADGDFDPESFAQQARIASVKMIEVKLSQGAKPGHGGILPGAKVSAEIAAARGVAKGVDCVSPPGHRTFSTPRGLLEFVARLRELSGGKPVGFKLCLGHPVEFLSICKAMLETRLLPDFVTVDGAEGGTGAAPIEFSDHVGTPLREGLVFVHGALVGTGLRDRVRVVASGKLVSGFEMAVASALGADLVNSARGYMLALGCIQAQRCHTNGCPVGIATQSHWLQRAVVVPEKAKRVVGFHHKTLEAFAEVVAAAGLDHPSELGPQHVYRSVSPFEIKPLSQIYHFLEPGQLLDDRPDGFFAPYWEAASPHAFRPS